MKMKRMKISFNKILVPATIVAVTLFVTGCSGTKLGDAFKDLTDWQVKTGKIKKPTEPKPKTGNRSGSQAGKDAVPTPQDCAYGSMLEQLKCAEKRTRARKAGRR